MRDLQLVHEGQPLLRRPTHHPAPRPLREEGRRRALAVRAAYQAYSKLPRSLGITISVA